MLGSATTLFLATGNIRWNVLGFLILYMALYTYDKGLNLETALTLMSLLLIMIPSKLVLLRLSQVLKLQYSQFAAEHRKLLQAKIETKNARSANEAKTQFLAHVNHELRTPLTAIAGFTDLLGSEQLPSEQHAEFLQIIQRNIKHLKNFIADMLDMAKIEAGEMLIEKAEVSLRTEMEDIIALLKKSANDKGIDLIFERTATVPAVVITDVTRIRQIVINLINNAIKFTNQGRVLLKLSFEPLAAKGQLHCLVIDTGIGIAPELQDRIFESFGQIRHASFDPRTGTGLGLTLSRRLARTMGGDVRLLHSTVGEGSTFEAIIPVETVSDITAERNASNHELVDRTVARDQLNGMKILVVEVNQDTQIFVKTLLAGQGAEIVQAFNGREALAATAKNRFDLNLMDMRMPEMDGYEATQRLRNEGNQTPIIAFTAHALTDALDDALGVGCNGYITKPLNKKDLLDMIRKYHS